MLHMVWALLLAKDANTRATIASFPNASITPDQYYNIQITLSFVSLLLLVVLRSGSVLIKGENDGKALKYSEIGEERDNIVQSVTEYWDARCPQCGVTGSALVVWRSLCCLCFVRLLCLNYWNISI